MDTSNLAPAGTTLTYASTGVCYENMDPFKRAAIQVALGTAGNIACFHPGYQEYEPSRGESTYLVTMPGPEKKKIGITIEGLGSKGRIAETMYRLTGNAQHFASVAQCAVAMIANDMITMNVQPITIVMYCAVGDSHWFDDQKRSGNLLNGWAKACDMARCSYGGGETPTLVKIIAPTTFDLAGAGVGIIEHEDHMITDKIEAGDQIVVFESSGIHANGLTLASSIAEHKDPLWLKVLHFCLGWLIGGWLNKKRPLRELPDGYLTAMPNGQTYGEALLTPTLIYVSVIAECIAAGVPIHYAANITGHGWRKIMRSTRAFTYIIERLPRHQAVFDFIIQRGPISLREMFGNFNMGAGFAIFVPESYVPQVLEIAQKYGHTAVHVGRVEAGSKKVVIVPHDITFEGEELKVR